MADYVPLEPRDGTFGEITISSYISHFQQVQREFGDLPVAATGDLMSCIPHVPSGSLLERMTYQNDGTYVRDDDGALVIHIDNV